MSRSVKKGPYVNEKLLAKIVAMNESGEKKVLKTWRGPTPSSPTWSATPLPFMTAESMYPYILQKTW